MKLEFTAKYSFVPTLLVAVALYLPGLPLDGVNATPPEPTPNPAVDIRTRVRPYQTLDAESFRPDSRVFEEIPLRSGVEEYPASALDTRTLYAIADATVLQGYPTVNLGDTTDMWAGYDEYLEPDGKIARSLIRFDIASLPPDATIIEATLRVYLVGFWDYPDTSRTITTYRITSSWSESSVTWINRPGYGAAYGSTSIVSGEWDWYEFDVTDLISAWCDGTYTNHGIMLRGPEVSGLDSSWRSFGTREGSHTPQLTVEYATTPPLLVDSITPDTGTNDGVVHITNLAGANFQTGATVELTRVGEPDINATNVVVVNAAQITCDFDLTGAAVGLWDVVVTNPDDRSGTLPGGFTVEAAPPRVDSITPDSGTNDGIAHITNLAGANFQTGATVELTRVGEPDINATNVVVVNAARITCDFDLTGAAVGLWDVVVTNPGGQSEALPHGFTITPKQEYTVYLPLMLKRWPPIPYTPVLNSISNPDGDGNYTVSWGAVNGATSYTLEEDDNAAFSSPTTVYSGPNTSKSITGRDVGTYYYRVRASNEFGSSAWSGVRSIVVIIPPTGPEPGHYTGTPSVSFDVTEDQQVCNFDMTIPFAGGSCRIHALSCTEIVDNGVTFVESHPVFGVVMWITGTFDSRTHVSGDYSVSMCGNELISPPSQGTWEANK